MRGSVRKYAWIKPGPVRKYAWVISGKGLGLVPGQDVTNGPPYAPYEGRKANEDD